jgi:ferric-dicitrate binding protein FerR (iron transport regulator)
MTKETRISQLIVRYLCGELSDKEREELHAWIEARESHRRLFQELCSLEAVKEDVRAREAVDSKTAVEAMRRRIQESEALEEDVRPTVGSKFRSLRVWVSAAVITLFVSLVGLGGWEYYSHVSKWKGEALAKAEQARQSQIKAGTTKAMLMLSDGRMIRLGSNIKMNKAAVRRALGNSYKGTIVLETPRGGEYSITMTDGTEVCLNAGSRIEYPAVFDGKERRVKTTGEAYFKVAHDADHPFIVETEGQEVKVLGTEFNINAYSADKVVTTLIRGSIALKPMGSKGGELTLKPGDQAEYDKHNGTATLHPANTDVVSSWTRGKFVFEDQTLGQIMESLGRWYDFRYHFSNPKLASTVFMGSVPRYGNFQNVLHILEMSGGIKFRVQGKTVEVLEVRN